jgi:hypothetical protein
VPETIFILLDPDTGTMLNEYAACGPVWITQSPENRQAAEAYWASKSESDHSVTIWSEPRSGESEEEWLGILDDIELHHGEAWSGPGVEAIEVRGVSLSDHAAAAFREFGYEVSETRGDGFRARSAA